MPVLRVSDETNDKLLEIKCSLIRSKKKDVSWDEVIQELLKGRGSK